MPSGRPASQPASGCLRGRRERERGAESFCGAGNRQRGGNYLSYFQMSESLSFSRSIPRPPALSLVMVMTPCKRHPALGLAKRATARKARGRLGAREREREKRALERRIGLLSRSLPLSSAAKRNDNRSASHLTLCLACSFGLGKKLASERESERHE